MSDTPPVEPVQHLAGNPDDLLLENIRNIALTPTSIRKIFILMTRLHWSSPDHYGALKKTLGTFVWDRDAKKRTLHVDFDYHYDPKKMEPRPAIYVGTSDIDFSRAVVDNQRSQSPDRSAEEYVKIATTNVIIRHLGKTPDESWEMGDLTAQFFMGMRKLLQETLKVHSFEVVKLMASKPFERATQEADQQFVVDLLMQLQYNSAWLIVREGHRLKTVTYKQSLECFSASD